MPTSTAIATSQAATAQEAAHMASVTIKNQLNSVQTDLVLLFATPDYCTQEMLDTVHTILKPHRLVGSSTTGIISSEGIFRHGVGLMAVNSNEMSFGISYSHPPPDGDLRNAGYDWGRRISADCKTAQHQGCLFLTDPALDNHSPFLRGVQEVLGFGFPLVGGICGELFKQKKTCQFFQKQILSPCTVGLLLSGLTLGLGHKHGLKPLGKPRTITKADGNVINTIDGLPALHIYEEFLGPEASLFHKERVTQYSLMYPLGIYVEEYRQYLLKNAVDIRSDGSIVCQGEVPEGAEVHLMIGNRDTCRQSAADAARQVKDALGGRQAKVILIIESVSRHNILKNQSIAEIQAIKEILGYTTPIIGLYVSSEIVPMIKGYGIHQSVVQNESILILALN